jgi:hypothetical protein
VNQHRSARDVEFFECLPGNGAARSAERANDNALQFSDRLQRQAGDVDAVFEAMKRTVDVGAGVRDQRDLADLEFRARRINLSRLQPAQVIADHRRRQAFVSDHAVFDVVAQLDQGRGGSHVSSGPDK